MCERRNLINVLNTQSTSRIIQKLTPDSLVPNLNQAINLIENYPSSHELRYKSFHQPRQVSKGCHFSFNTPMKRDHYCVLLLSHQALNDLNLQTAPNDQETSQILSGEKVFYSKERGVFPYSLAYAGFQFGQFAGQLGDGRLVNLFDIKNNLNNWQTLQIKGSGITPFSRFGDGKAVVRSSIREFIISESLYHVGIPSTRAVQLTLLPRTTATRQVEEPCAVVCRFAPSWIRIGNFDLFRMRPDLEGLIKLSDYCIEEVFDNGKDFPEDVDSNLFIKDCFPDDDVEPSAVGTSNETLEDISKYDLFYRHVVNLNAKCVAYWQAYGFLNGVLNTDNTSIMGLSIDFGPFNFLDRFEPDFTPNHDDSMKRYSFQNQPGVIWWNLVQLGQSLSFLIGSGKTGLEETIKGGYKEMTQEREAKLVKRANVLLRHCSNEYKYRFTTMYAHLMACRLGIDLEIDLVQCGRNKDGLERTSKVVKEFLDTITEPLLKILQRTKIDYNNFFINLQQYKDKIPDVQLNVNNFKNPLEVLPREYLQIFFTPEQLNKLEASGEDLGETKLLEETLREVIEWTRSYAFLTEDNRVSVSEQYNPLFLPRSWVLEEVIADLTERQKQQLQDPDSILDTSLLEKLHAMSSNPYDKTKWLPQLHEYAQERWTDTSNLPTEMKQLSCSS